MNTQFVDDIYNHIITSYPCFDNNHNIQQFIYDTYSNNISSSNIDEIYYQILHKFYPSAYDYLQKLKIQNPYFTKKKLINIIEI